MPYQSKYSFCSCVITTAFKVTKISNILKKYHILSIAILVNGWWEIYPSHIKIMPYTRKSLLFFFCIMAFRCIMSASIIVAKCFCASRRYEKGKEGAEVCNSRFCLMRTRRWMWTLFCCSSNFWIIVPIVKWMGMRT